MATDIVQSLFGVTPQGYQQQQADMASQQAMQYARLDPFQQANYAIGRGAYGLAGALGGALGGQDPELQLISTRNSIAKQIDYSDLNSISQGVRMLGEAGDTVGAMQLQQVLLGQQAKLASIGKDVAAGKASLAQAGREKVQPSPKEVQLAREVALLSGPEGSIEYNTAYATSLQEQMAKPESKKPTTNELTNAENIALQSGPVGSPAYNKAFMDEYKRLTAPKEDKGPAFGTDREAVAAEIYGATFGELTQAQKAVVNKRVEEEGGRKAAAGASKFVLPGQPVPTKDWMDFSTKILSGDPTMVRTSTIISDAPNAIDIIRSSTDNDISAAALPGALARLTGEGKNMSNQDVARFARTGGLDDRLVQDAVKFFTGKTTTVKKEQAEQFATSLYRGALLERKKKLSNEAEQFGYSESPNYKIALRQIDEQLSQISAPSTPANTKTITLKSGKTVIVTEN